MKDYNTFFKLHIITNLAFYMGLLWTFNLFFEKENSSIWLIVYILVIISMLGSAISDMLINMGVTVIGKGIVRSAIILKGSLFVLVYTVMNYDNWNYILIIVAIISIVDIPVEIILGGKVKKLDVTAKDIICRLNEVESKGVEKLGKYLFGNLLNMGLFINMQENYIEIIIFAILCIAIHAYLSEKIVSVISQNRVIRTWKIRLIMWIIHIGTMSCVVFKILSLCYLLMGFYWMVVTDIAIEKETALVRMKDK